MFGKFVIWKMLKSFAFLLVEFMDVSDMLWEVVMVMARWRIIFTK